MHWWPKTLRASGSGDGCHLSAEVEATDTAYQWLQRTSWRAREWCWMGEIIFWTLRSIPCSVLRCWPAAVSLHKSQRHTPMPTPKSFTMCWFFSIIWPGAQIKPNFCKEITLVSTCWCFASTADLHIEASLGGRGAMERHPASRTVLQILTNRATLDKKQLKKEK